jgi:hypothetical protein
MDESFPRFGYHETTMAELTEAARRAGYVPTEHGTLQRGYWHAVRLVPMTTGVVVRKAWTTAQIIVLGVVLTLIAIGVAAG